MEDQSTFATKQIEIEFKEPIEDEDENKNKKRKDIPPLPIKIILSKENSSSYINNEEEEQVNEEEENDPYFKLKVKAINNEPLGDLDDETYEGLLLSLKEERAELVENNYPDESKIINEAYYNVLRAYEEQKKKNAQKEAYKENRKRLKQAKKEYKETVEGYDRQEKLLIQRLTDKMKRIEQKHEQQIAAYQEEWQSSAKIRKYSKQSSKLSTLRLQAKRLLMCSRYDEAKMVRAQADALQQQETMQQQKAMQSDYQQGLDTILANQKAELDTVKKQNDLEIGKLKKDREIELEVCKKRIANIEAFTESTKDEEKVWSRKKSSFQRPKVLLPTQRCLSATQRTNRAASNLNALQIQPIIPNKTERLSEKDYASLV